MPGVTIDPNIKKSAVRLDFNGNEIDPKTKEIVKPVEAEYVPPQTDSAGRVETDSAGRVETDTSAPKQDLSTPSPLAQAIKEQVQAAVKESIKEINIKEMVDQAIREAFK